jgi:hypothetical protein
MMATEDQEQRGPSATWWLLLVVSCLVFYLLSSGPVIATAFWLREATNWNGFYSVLYFYYPLLIWGRDNPIEMYIEWWVDLLGTVGPG